MSIDFREAIITHRACGALMREEGWRAAAPRASLLLSPRRRVPAFPRAGVDGGGGSVPFSPHGDVSLPSQQQDVDSRRRQCSLLSPRRCFPVSPTTGVDWGGGSVLFSPPTATFPGLSKSGSRWRRLAQPGASIYSRCWER